MAETNEEGVGFDRRSLIKKGLVAGGIAATAPVISTFNVPAFAQSPGRYLIAINLVTLNGGITVNQRVAASPTGGCADIAAEFPGPFVADPGDAVIDIDASLSPNTLTTRILTFALMGAAATDCTFLAARRRSGTIPFTDCTDDEPPVPSDSVSFVVNVNSNSQYHFVVECV